MKADATSGNPTKISTNTDSQSQNSGKRKLSEFSCNPGMQKQELFSCCRPCDGFRRHLDE